MKMQALSAAELLAVWERGLAQQPWQQALMLLAAACPETSPAALAQLSIGRRDARLLILREWTFGPQLVSLAPCPGCGEHLELDFDVATVRVTPSTNGAESEGVEALSLTMAGYEVHFRLPNSLDLMAVTGQTEIVATRLLLERCILAVGHHGTEIPTTALPDDVVAAIVDRMAQADPQADIQLALTCPACDHQWPATFDILSFFWSEINDWAYRILGEVHILARAYGWREADILALSPWRRQAYLEMVSG